MVIDQTLVQSLIENSAQILLISSVVRIWGRRWFFWGGHICRGSNLKAIRSRSDRPRSSLKVFGSWKCKEYVLDRSLFYSKAGKMWKNRKTTVSEISFERRRFMKRSCWILQGLIMGYLTSKYFDKARCWCWVINHNVFYSGYLFFMVRIFTRKVK